MKRFILFFLISYCQAKNNEQRIRYIHENDPYSTELFLQQLTLTIGPMVIFSAGYLLYNEFLKFKKKRSLKKTDPIIGYEEEKESIRTILKNFVEEYTSHKFKTNHAEGIILYGPPGTGKTTLAINIIEQLGVPFQIMTLDDIQSSWVGQTEKSLQAILDTARKKKPSVIVIDEIDQIFTKDQTDIYNTYKNLSKILISFMDGIEDSSGVFIIGTTNYIDNIPDPLLRDGRFGNLIEIDYPSLKDRKNILSYYLEEYGVKIDKEVLDYAAQKTEQYNNANLKGLCKYIAQNKDKIKKEKNNNTTNSSLTKADFNILFRNKENIKISSHDKNTIDPDTLWDLCLHEAAHAMVNFLFQLDKKSCYEFDTVTIDGMKGSLGSSHSIIPSKITSFTKEKLLNQIKIAFAGRIAQEKIGSQQIDTGAESDFESASAIAKDIILRYGMGKNKFVFNDKILERGAILPGQNITTEIETILREEYKKTEEIIEQYKDFLIMIANKLKDKKNLYYEDLVKLYDQYKEKKTLSQANMTQNRSKNKKIKTRYRL